MKRSLSKPDSALGRIAMKQKLTDACSTAGRLRREKKQLKVTLTTDCEYTKSKTKRVVKKIMKKASSFRNLQRLKVEKKFDHYRKKKYQAETEEERRYIPRDIWDILENVNMFNKTVSPEQPADLMVCSESIKLSRCERAFLRKGPKFMIRKELNESEFVVDLHKMIIKEKKDKSDAPEVDNKAGEDLNVHNIDERKIKIMDKARLVYDKEDKSLDLGRMRASDYKYNKMVYLPKPEDSRRESLHEVRKEQMLAVFREVKRQGDLEKEHECSQRGAARRIERKSLHTNRVPDWQKDDKRDSAA